MASGQDVDFVATERSCVMSFAITARRANESRSLNNEGRGLIVVQQRDFASRKAGAT